MSACLRCTAKSQLFLCTRCQTHLADLLAGLPRWINYLTEAALGLTTMGGDGAGMRGWREPFHLDGDASASQDDDKLLEKFLRAGRIDARASRELDMLTSMLAAWIRDLCETRGLDAPMCRNAAQMARWLTIHVSAVSSHPGADEFCDELEERVRRIERIINRPEPPRTLGPCPTVVDRHECATALYTRREAIEVTCPMCRVTHNVESLTIRLLADSGHKRFTVRELCDLILPRLDEHVPRRTLYDWLAKGRLVAAGYRRPDGRIALTRHSADDEAMVRLDDVRAARLKKWQRMVG